MKKGGFFFAFLLRLLKRKKVFRLGVYGPPNVGKTSIANWISKQWTGEEIGTVSNVPHETRTVVGKDKVIIEKKGKKLEINLFDTPGISTKVDFEEFLKFGVKKTEAKKRAREATKGIIESIKSLDDMDMVLAVMDSTKDPYTQINITIIGNLEARKIPVLIVANKIDLKTANIERVNSAFPQYRIVGLSAKEGTGFDDLYNALFDLSREVK